MKKISFNENWTFKTDKHVIENLILPHDAQLLDGRKADSPGGSGHGYFVGNIYEYEKHFDVPKEWEEKHVEILFEGVYRNCEVKLNGNKLMSSPEMRLLPVTFPEMYWKVLTVARNIREMLTPFAE